MKQIHCRACNSAHSLKADGAITKCDCEKVLGWYSDPDNGFAVVYTPKEADRELLHVISMHNGFLNDGPVMIPDHYYDTLTSHKMPYPEQQLDTFWRNLHVQASIAPRAPETVRTWDRSRRECWAVILTPGTSIDVQWATPEQVKEKLSVKASVA